MIVKLFELELMKEFGMNLDHIPDVPHNIVSSQIFAKYLTIFWSLSDNNHAICRYLVSNGILNLIEILLKVEPFYNCELYLLGLLVIVDGRLLFFCLFNYFVLVTIYIKNLDSSKINKLPWPMLDFFDCIK